MDTDNKISEDTQKAISGLWEKIKKAAEITQESNSKYGEVASTLHELQSALNQKNSKLESLQIAFEESAIKERTLLAEKSEIQSRLDNISKQFSEYEPVFKERTALLITNEKLTEKISELQRQVDEIPAIKNSLEAAELELKQLHEVSKSDKKEIGSLTKIANDFTFAQKEITRKNFEIHEKQNELQKAKNELAEVKSQLFILKNKENELAEAKDENEKIKSELHSLEQAHKELLLKQEESELNFNIHKEQYEAEQQKNEHVIKSHEQTIADLMGKLLVSQTAVQEYEKSTLSHNLKINELEKAVQKQHEDWLLVSSKLIDSENNLSAADALILELKDQVALMEKHTSDYDLQKAELARLQADAQQSRQERTELENKNKQFSDEIGELSIKLESLENLLQSRDEQIASQSKEIEELNGKNIAMHDKLGMLQAENLKLLDDIEVYTLLESKFEILEDECLHTKKENESLVEQKRMLTNQLSDFSNKLDAASQEIDSLMKVNNELKATLATMEEYNSKLSDSRAQIENMSDDIKKISSENASLANEVEDKNKQLTELRGELEKITAENESLNRERLSGYDMIFEVSSSQRIEEFKASIANLEKTLSEKDKAIEKLNKQIDKLKTKLVYSNAPELFPLDNSEKAEQFESELDDLKSAIAEKDKQIDEYKLIIENLKDNHIIDSQKKMIMDLTAEKTLKELQLANIQKKSDSLEDLLRTRYKHIQILEREIDELLHNSKSKQAEKNELIAKIEKVISQLERGE